MTDALSSFDGMCWPNAGLDLQELEHRLRYGDVDGADRMLAATVVAAYMEIILCNRTKREYVVRNLRQIRD